MFTGLIEQQGQVLQTIQTDVGQRVAVRTTCKNLNIGESVALNGVCLTICGFDTDQIFFDLSPETISKTNLGLLKIGDTVHLERAMLATSRFGGHYVSGHVDTTVCLKSKKQIGAFFELIVGPFEATEIRYLIPKGSIAIDGISLTINTVENNCITLLLVPHTLTQTSLAEKPVGTWLNVEFDYLARIVVHQLAL